MALLAYDQIQQTVKRYLWDRDDLSGMIPDFITLAEARLNNVLRTADQETSATVTLTSGSGPLPTDYLAWRRVLTTDSPVRTLEWAEPSWAEEHYYAQTAAGLACHFTIVGSTIKTYPPAGTGVNLTLQYYKKIPALASNGTGNWITSRAPGLYIYAAMIEASPFLDDDDRVSTWGQMFNDAVTKLQQTDRQGRYARSAIRISRATP